MSQKIFHLLVILTLLFVSVSLGLNIINQISSVYKAKITFDTLRTEVQKLENEAKYWSLKASESTSSAFYRRQARVLLGLGQSNDAWVRLPPEREFSTIITPTPIPKPNWQQWLDLFTAY